MPRSRRLRARWRIAASDGRVCVRFVRPDLAYDDVRDVLEALMVGRCTHWSVINIDLSNVCNIVRPWTPIVALIVYWAMKCGIRFRLTGLNQQLAGVASLVPVALREANVEWQA